MNKFLGILLVFVIINGFSSLTSFMFPTIPVDKIFPIQVWINALLLFAVFLPNSVAPFLKNL